ncbi:MAG: NADH-quinone oxidoreductase subunit L [Legionellales bacterium]|nr:NADH-quinone oxidoreductase subunit L [Legionellales bacterium]
MIVLIVLLPMAGSLIAGILGHKIGREGAHRITILGVGVAFALALYVAKLIFIDNQAAQSWTLYTWVNSGSFDFSIGFLVDRLSTLMLLVVLFVSFLVHIYSIGYMQDDPGYQRFFSYISAFTFAMLCLVLGNNFLVLFFGWEGVGLVSYLLIGFWFKKESAVQGSLKAFLVNRVGDFGFILGLGAVLTHFGTLDYATVFADAPALTQTHELITVFPFMHWQVMSAICLLLFIGAMGKSAQIPLHIWLPESMEGPTPISALIHAATMVTAGIYMVARLSPLFELSPVALSTIMIIGATGALFLGILGLVQNDIKRVVAYSTLSQLGYMVAGLGASAFAASIFHLATHACFKALLFLGAGSVIIGMHHDQDMRNMGGLYKYMPITYLTFLIGSLSLAAIPPFSGFYSKDAIIEAVGHAELYGSHYAYICVVIGSFVTALYTFRAFFMTFHGEERIDHHTRDHLHESPWTVWLPLVILAIPSIFLGALLNYHILYDPNSLLGSSILVAKQYDVLGAMSADYPGIVGMITHAVMTLPFWFAMAGILVAWIFYHQYPQLPTKVARKMEIIYLILINKYGFDYFNDVIFVRGSRRLGSFFYKVSDLIFIDGFFVNGSGRLVNRLSSMIRRLQSGYLYHYAFVMVIGLLFFLCWLVLGA